MFSFSGFSGIANGLVSGHVSFRFGVQFNRHFALSFAPSFWLISADLLPSFQLMGEWMPFDILQIGIGAGYDHGSGEGPSSTFRVAVSLVGRQSGERRDGLMLVFTSHATVLFNQFGLGYDFY